MQREEIVMYLIILYETFASLLSVTWHLSLKIILSRKAKTNEWLLVLEGGKPGRTFAAGPPLEQSPVKAKSFIVFQKGNK